MRFPLHVAMGLLPNTIPTGYCNSLSGPLDIQFSPSHLLAGFISYHAHYTQTIFERRGLPP